MEFLRAVAARLPEHLPPERADAHIRAGYLLKVHFGQPRIHYELWPRRDAGLLELGLHAEAAPQANAAILAALEERAETLLPALGAAWEPEYWTRSWTRLHVTLPYDPLDTGRVEEVAALLGRAIALIQPIVDQAVTELSPEAVDPAPRGRPRFRR